MCDETMGAERATFLSLAVLVQGGLLLVALSVGWLVGNPPWRQCAWTGESIGLGGLATVPMLLFLVLTYRSKSKSLVQIRQFLRDVLGRPLAACGWLDLGALALLAGFSEECLFRGVLEPCLSVWSPLAGLVLCNLLFGACHAVTPMYAVFAALLGCYLSTTQWLTTERNLAVPIVCHSLYDLVAFVVVRNSYCRYHVQVPPNDNDSRDVNLTPNTPVSPIPH